MTRTRTLGLVLTLTSSVVFLASVYLMAGRLRDFNAAQDFSAWTFERVGQRELTIYGHPVSLIDHVDELGRTTLHLTYGSTTFDIPVKPPPALDIPDLGIYEEWLAVLGAVELMRDEADQPTSILDIVGSVTENPDTARVVIVSRVPPTGYDPDSWGSVLKDDWTFHFYELHPDASVTTSVYRWPRKPRSEARLQAEPTNPLYSIPPLAERTFEYQAALHAMPKLTVPSHKFNDTALPAAGWTFPAAGFSMMTLLLGLALVFSPSQSAKSKSL